jgi:hypothetical protein
MNTADQHAAAMAIVHEEAGRTLSKDDFDLCMRIAKRALPHSDAAQAPVCWAAYNGVCVQAFFKSKEAADSYAKEMQKNHDLSGSLAAFTVKPLYVAPGAAAQGESATTGVIAAAEALIAADRVCALTDEHVNALENAIAIQRGNVALPMAAQGEVVRVAELEREIADLKATAEKKDAKSAELGKMLANIIHDQTVAMQAAIIEWQHGKGAEAGFNWIVNTLEGPGHLPDFDAPYGKQPQFWFDSNRAEPFPKCFCGNPSHQLWMGQGFCCNTHYAEAKAKHDAATAPSTGDLGVES